MTRQSIAFLFLAATLACGNMSTGPQFSTDGAVSLAPQASPYHVAQTAFAGGTIAHQDSFIYASSRPSGVATATTSFTFPAGVLSVTGFRAQLYVDQAGLDVPSGQARIVDVYLVRGLSGDTVFTIVGGVSAYTGMDPNGWQIKSAALSQSVNSAATYSVITEFRDGHNGAGASQSLRMAWSEVAYSPISAAPRPLVASSLEGRILRLRDGRVLIE